MNSRAKTLVWINTLTFVIVLIANFIAGSGKFINTTVGEISNKYDTLFAPAGYAFIIWSAIFLLLACFCIYQWYLLRKGDEKNYIVRTSYWFAFSNLCNSLWLYCWLNEWLGISVVVILLLLVSLIVLTVRLRLELDDERVQIIFFVWWPITIYLGWLMVATIACVAAWLSSTELKHALPGENLVTIAMIIIATVLYLLLIKFRNLREAALVGVWAFVAIAVKQWYLHRDIAIASLIASSVLLIVVSIHGHVNRQTSPFAKLRRNEW